MVMIRVTSRWQGPQIRGGGITQFYFGEGSVDAQACADAVYTFWDSLKAGWAPDNIVTIDGNVSSFDEATGDLLSGGIVAVTGPVEGTGSGDALPPATQCLVRWTTNEVHKNRYVRGHTFLPAQLEGNCDASGQVSSAFMAFVSGAANDLVDDADTQLVIWARPSPGFPGEAAAVQSASVWNEWSILRGRRD